MQTISLKKLEPDKKDKTLLTNYDLNNNFKYESGGSIEDG